MKIFLLVFSTKPFPNGVVLTFLYAEECKAKSFSTIFQKFYSFRANFNFCATKFQILLRGTANLVQNNET